MAIKGITSRPSVAWAVPPSPTRDICFVFCALADPGTDRATTGRTGHKQHQKNCANLCTIVQTFSKKNPAEAGFFITAIFKQFSFDTQTLKLHSQSSHMTQKPKCHH